jgi:hypothetical protein
MGDVLERHFDEYRRLYTCGSGDPEAPYFARFNTARLDEDDQTKVSQTLRLAQLARNTH